jgi:hypothetical protein
MLFHPLHYAVHTVTNGIPLHLLTLLKITKKWNNEMKISVSLQYQILATSDGVFMDGSQQPTHIFTMSQHSSQ